jgi:hypothetical protein
MRRRWLLRAVIALPIVLLTLLVGACGGGMYLHAIWEGANDECGRHAPPTAQGWGIAFHGDEDVFVCTYTGNGVRQVGQRKLAPEEYMGTSGSWPLFSDLVAHELEAIDGDLP